MTFAALVLLLAIPQSGPVPQNGETPSGSTTLVVWTDASTSDTGKASDNSTTVPGANTKDSSLSASNLLPSMPVPKVNSSTAEPAPAAFPVSPVKAPAKLYSETPTQRKVWYTLAAAGHAGAAFDAWSTRRAISGGYGTEANPLLRPFAHSGALYVATQVSPAFMDFLGKRMMTSRYGMFRKLWWLPQAAGASVSFAAGAHNVGLTQ
jgi:hypothetical protein